MKLKFDAWNSFIDISFHEGNEMWTSFRELFSFQLTGIYKRKRAKFGQTERKHEKNFSLHRSRIPNLIVQHDIRASRSQCQSHNNGKSSETYKETFLRNRSLEREFLRTLNLRTLGIDLVTVFDAILTSRQTREKLQCLYENLMSNIFRYNGSSEKNMNVN